MWVAFVLFLAALQDIPPDLTDAALIDGAGRWSRLRFIILPHIRPVLSMVVTLQLLATFRIFSQVYVMTNGGPGVSSTSPIFYVYSVAIVRNLFGYASAIALLLFVLILTLALAAYGRRAESADTKELADSLAEAKVPQARHAAIACLSILSSAEFLTR